MRHPAWAPGIDDAADVLEASGVCQLVETVRLPEPAGDQSGGFRLLDQLRMIDQIQDQGSTGSTVVVRPSDLDQAPATVLPAVPWQRVSHPPAIHDVCDLLGLAGHLCSQGGVKAIWPDSSGQWRSPGTDAWWKRMGAAMDAICDDQGRPVCRLHGLRMLDPTIFQHLPFASADSTNAAVNGGSISRFGMYAPPTAGQRANVIADRVEAYNSAPVWQSKQLEIAL